MFTKARIFVLLSFSITFFSLFTQHFYSRIHFYTLIFHEKVAII